MEEFYATCPAGFERALAHELSSLGAAQVRPLTGLVSFFGETGTGYAACLWSRLASRVVLVLARFDAPDEAALHDGMAEVPWEDHLPLDATFAIDAHGTNDRLRSTRFVAERAKDGVVDRLLARRGGRARVDVRDPDVTLALRLSGRRASAGVVLSGARPLFERGYEREGRLPSLRADYACRLLLLAGLADAAAPAGAGVLVGWPGAGALAVEAALVRAGRAPGLLRTRWGFERWLGHDRDAWERLRAQAEEATRDAEGAGGGPLLAFDRRRGAEGACRRALAAAGLPAEAVQFVPADRLPEATGAWACAALDLSWLRGNLVREAQELPALPALARAAGPGSRLALAAEPAAVGDLAPLLGTPSARVDTRLGSSPLALAAWDVSGGEQGSPAPLTLADGTALTPLVAASDQFAARLAKATRLRGRWARRELVDAYRVYDADLPDYSLAIDLLSTVEPQGGRFAVICEYAPPRDVDAALARRRLLDALAIAPHVLDVAPGDLVLRRRERARGGSQYATDDARDPRPRRVVVEEGGLAFELDLSRRHDYGLFLDHRDTRALLREMAKAMPAPRRFLNLFCYTGSATVYAADGGAAKTVSVDLSRPSLDVAARNLRRNGFGGPGHRLVQADVLAWVDEQRHRRDGERFGLVFCDVPTFSNSARMRGRSFDVQRDHAELLISVSRLLTPGGVCLFSCNLRRFRPDTEALGRAGVTIEDITARTIPEDFSRTPHVHHAYLVRRV